MMQKNVCNSDRKPLIIMVWVYAGITLFTYLLFPIVPFLLPCSVLGAHGIYYLFMLLLMTKDISSVFLGTVLSVILIIAIVALIISFFVLLVMAIRGKFKPFGYFCIINTAISVIVLLVGSFFGGSELINGNLVPFLLLELVGNTIFCYNYFSTNSKTGDGLREP